MTIHHECQTNGSWSDTLSTGSVCWIKGPTLVCTPPASHSVSSTDSWDQTMATWTRFLSLVLLLFIIQDIKGSSSNHKVCLVSTRYHRAHAGLLQTIDEYLTQTDFRAPTVNQRLTNFHFKTQGFLFSKLFHRYDESFQRWFQIPSSYPHTGNIMEISKAVISPMMNPCSINQTAIFTYGFIFSSNSIAAPFPRQMCPATLKYRATFSRRWNKRD